MIAALLLFYAACGCHVALTYPLGNRPEWWRRVVYAFLVFWVWPILLLWEDVR